MKLLTTLLVLSMATLTAVAQQPQSAGTSKDFVLGRVETIHSTILAEDRTLNIYLPEGYDKAARYPVIYLLDGSADEDFIHVTGIVQYNTFSWINRIPKSIVVGIANTSRKHNFTSPSNRETDNKLVPNAGGSADFITFLEKELQPYISAHYQTNGTKTLIGQSLGGLLATEVLFTKPELFNNYIIISPSLWWRDGYLLSTPAAVLGSGYNIPTQIYIGVGKEGSIDGSKNHVMEEDAKLLYTKIQQAKSARIKVFFDYLPEENHATVTHQAVFNAFRMLYPKK